MKRGEVLVVREITNALDHASKAILVVSKILYSIKNVPELCLYSTLGFQDYTRGRDLPANHKEVENCILRKRMGGYETWRKA